VTDVPVSMIEWIRRGIDEFNRELFFEAHETLEQVWRSEWRQNRRPFYQGLIQLSVGFYHWRNGNRRGAVNLLRRGSTNLAAYAPKFHGIDVSALLSRARECAERIEKDPDGREFGYARHLVPRIGLDDLGSLQRDWEE